MFGLSLLNDLDDYSGLLGRLGHFNLFGLRFRFFIFMQAIYDFLDFTNSFFSDLLNILANLTFENFLSRMLGLSDTRVDGVVDEVEDIEGRAEATALALTFLQVTSSGAELVLFLSEPLHFLLLDLFGRHAGVILELPVLLVLAEHIVFSAHPHLLMEAIHFACELEVKNDLEDAKERGNYKEEAAAPEGAANPSVLLRVGLAGAEANGCGNEDAQPHYESNEGGAGFIVLHVALSHPHLVVHFCFLLTGLSGLAIMFIESFLDLFK